MINITIINKINAEAFLPVMASDARTEFELQYLSDSADKIKKDIFALGISEDDQIAGAIVFYYDNENTAVINSLFIRENYRRKGYGTELVIAASSLCQNNDLCTKLEITAPTFTSFDNNLCNLFNYLEFEKEELGDTGCFEIILADVTSNATLSNAKSTAISLKNTNQAQKVSLDELAYDGLSAEVLNNFVDLDISSCMCEGNKITDCMIFSYNEEKQLVLTWAEVSPKHPAAFMDLLAKSVALISAKYNKNQQILIPYVNEHSKNLILKILGDKAKLRETYTRYWIDLDEPYEDEEE